MKLKIISDGTAQGTSVVDTATGECIDNISRIDIEITPDSHAYANIYIITPEIDILCDAEVHTSGDTDDS